MQSCKLHTNIARLGIYFRTQSVYLYTGCQQYDANMFFIQMSDLKLDIMSFTVNYSQKDSTHNKKSINDGRKEIGCILVSYIIKCSVFFICFLFCFFFSKQFVGQVPVLRDIFSTSMVEICSQNYAFVYLNRCISIYYLRSIYTMIHNIILFCKMFVYIHELFHLYNKSYLQRNF